MIIGITGLSQTPDGQYKWNMGSGKDTVADLILKREGWVKVALADTMKRFARDLYGFTDEQLWGPSEMRNAVDKRWPCKHCWMDDEDFPHDRCYICGMSQPDFVSNEETPCYLTPRYVLVSLGNWGRRMHERTWANKVLEIARALLGEPEPYYDTGCHESRKGHRSYSAQGGLHHPYRGSPPIKGVLVSDVRYRGECRAIQEGGGKIIRIKRIQEQLPVAGVLNDSTERDLLTWDDNEFDHVLINDTLEGLPAAVGEMRERLT
jgi:hypothetical protein